jgi:hypothetical protein
MRLRTLTPAAADWLSCGEPITPIITDQEGTVLIGVVQPPDSYLLAMSGAVELAAVSSRWERMRLWAMCTAAVLGGSGLGIGVAIMLVSACDAVGRALG